MTALELANQAADLAFSDPAGARRLAESVLAAESADPASTSVAQQALGLVGLATGQLTEAEAHLQQAIRIADRPGTKGFAAEARGVLGYLLTMTGRSTDALRQMALALPDVNGVAAARLRMQRGLVYTEISRFDDAAADFAAALRALQQVGGDPLIEASIRNNRSIVLARRGDWRGAESDLLRAEEMFVANGHPGRTAMVYQNRGLAATVHGDIPAALAAFDEAAARYQAAGSDPGLLPIERAEALLSVRLLAEARIAATAAVAEYTRRDNAVDLVQARLLLARVAIAENDTPTATTEIERARRSAIRQGRRGWAAMASYLALRARWVDGEHSVSTLRAGQRAIAALETAGWVGPVNDARVIVARIALSLGRRKQARAALNAAAAARRTGAADGRARAWHATALLRLDDGDRRGADAALRAGIRILDGFSAALGATELRASAAGHARELADLGVRLAVESGSADRVLRWAEHQRGWALRLPPVRPPDDDQQALDLTRLRQLALDVQGAVARGEDPRPLIRRQAGLEQQIRDRTRRVAGVAGTSTNGPPGLAALSASLGSSALIEYLVLDGQLRAVVVVDGSASLHELGPIADVDRALTAVTFCCRRGIYGVETPSLVMQLDRAVDRLDRLVLRPLIGRVGDRQLVVVPTGPLHGLPWSLLPSCLGHPISVAPSATLWHGAATAAPSEDHRRVVVAGPGLPHAAAEVSELAGLYPDAEQLTGHAAAVDAVTAALDGAELGHIAAHGRFRDDNPQFSTLQLADGPLIVHDLLRLDRPPRHVVLSACDSGMSAGPTGDELLGFAAALLAQGTQSLVAALAQVPDESGRPLMLRFHHLLDSGLRPAAALAMAQQEQADTGVLADRIGAAGFLCFGAG